MKRAIEIAELVRPAFAAVTMCIMTVTISSCSMRPEAVIRCCDRDHAACQLTIWSAAYLNCQAFSFAAASMCIVESAAATQTRPLHACLLPDIGMLCHNDYQQHGTAEASHTPWKTE